MSEADRKTFVDRIRTQLAMNYYGVPFELRNLHPVHQVLKYRAIVELNVRLNLFIATGKRDEGKIDFPEVDRTIIYTFNAKHPLNSYINLKANHKGIRRKWVEKKHVNPDTVP